MDKWQSSITLEPVFNGIHVGPAKAKHNRRTNSSATNFMQRATRKLRVPEGSAEGKGHYDLNILNIYDFCAFIV